MPRQSGEPWTYDPADLSFNANLADGDTLWYQSATGKIVNLPTSVYDLLVDAGGTNVVLDASGNPILTLRGPPAVTVAGDASTIIPASAAFLQRATLTLTDAQIKTLLATPRTLVTPTAGTAIVPVAVWAIHDFTHGIYALSDPVNDDGTLKVVGLSSASDYVSQGAPITDGAVSPAQGATRFTTWPVMTHAAATYTVSEALICRAYSGNAGEFTGGGTGNTLKIYLYYIAVPTT